MEAWYPTFRHTWWAYSTYATDIICMCFYVYLCVGKREWGIDCIDNKDDIHARWISVNNAGSGSVNWCPWCVCERYLWSHVHWYHQQNQRGDISACHSRGAASYQYRRPWHLWLWRFQQKQANNVLCYVWNYYYVYSAWLAEWCLEGDFFHRWSCLFLKSPSSAYLLVKILLRPSFCLDLASVFALYMLTECSKDWTWTIKDVSACVFTVH